MKLARKRWSNVHDRLCRRECVVGVAWDVVLFAAIVVAILAFCGVVRGQCYIDPNTGQRVCTNGGGNWVSVSGPIGGVAVGDYGVGVAVGQPPQSPSRITPHPARCRISAETGSGWMDCGSGTIIGSRGDIEVVLTADHVIADSNGKIRIQFPDGRAWMGKVFDRDRVNDLAAIAIRPTGIQPMPVAESDPGGGPLIAGGFGDGPFSYMEGHIAGYVTPDGATQPCGVMVPSRGGNTRSGDSGGAVVNAQKQLCGVIWGGDGKATYITCGGPLRAFIRRVLWGNTVATLPANPTPIEPPPTLEPLKPPAETPNTPVIQPPSNPAPEPQDNSLVDKLAHEIAAIREDLKNIPAGQQGPPGPQGPAGVNGLPGANGVAPDTSKFATREDIAAVIAGRVARDGVTLALGTLGVSTGLAGVVAFFVGRRAASKVRTIIHQRHTAAGGTPDATFHDR